MWILKVIETLQSLKIQFAVAGGYAVALHGAARGTVDIDLVVLINKDNFEKIEIAMKALGLTSRLPITSKDVFQFRKEYIEKRNLIAWSFINYKNPAQVIDIIITHDLKKMTTTTVSVQGTKIPILSLKSLIKMKAEAGREQDLEDIKALKEIDEKS